MNDKEKNEMDHAWRYFELHANQRMALFNFFLVLSGLVSAGLAAAVQGPERFGGVGAALGLVLSLVSFVFWKLDQRVSFLMKQAESALAESEAALPILKARLFANEPALTTTACSAPGWWTRQWTHGKSFRVTFVVIGIFGIGGAILCILRFAGVLVWQTT